uniref:OppA protein n=1 Tax=Mycoplasma struthionis TaxID=538220 RepID=A0A0C5C0A7_9MOLU|nr:oligopeptide ABC transporter substrate-binding protein [Mycoplasma struthionis]
MKKSARLLLLGALPLAALAAPLVAAACNSKSAPSQNTALAKQQFVTEINATPTFDAYTYDSSASYGGYSSNASYQHTSGMLVREQGVNEIQIDTVTSDTGKVSNYITKPAFSKYTLSLAKAVVLTLTDGTVVVYDNDDAEVVPAPDLTYVDAAGETKKAYSSAYQRLSSANSKSINSQEFAENLKKAKTLQYVLKDNLKWVNSKGEETKYQIVPKDFYYSWLRTNQTIGNVRHDEEKSGGSEQLDNEVRDALARPNSRVFTDTSEYSNEYVLKIFGLDTVKLNEESEFVKKVAPSANLGDVTAVTFQGLTGEGAKVQMNQFFDQLMHDYTFYPAPSQYIDDMNATNGYKLTNYQGDVTDKVSALETKSKAMDKSKLTAKLGVYWYGVTANSTLYSGPYYAQGFVSGQSEIFKKNTHFAEKAFAESKNTVNEIITNYQQKTLSPEEFNTNIFNLYRQGTTSTTPYSSLTEAQKQIVNQDPQGFGIRLFKRENTNSAPYDIIQTPFVFNNVTADYSFNDAYAQLMYGKTIEELKAGKGTGDAYIYGTGLSFRTLLQAAINWNTVADVRTNGVSEAWLAKLADGGNIGGKDQESSAEKTPFDVKDKINALKAVNKDKQLVDFGGNLGKDLNPSENDAAVRDRSNVNDKIKSAGYEKIKEAVKALLDEFERTHQNVRPADGKYRFTSFYPFINQSKEFGESLKFVKEAIEGLDSRIQLDLVFFTDNKDPNYVAYINQGANGTRNVGWSYDYNSIGSGYDGLSWNWPLFPTLIKIGVEKDSHPEFATAFPRIAKLAEDLLAYQEQPGHEFVSSVPFKELYKVEPRRYTVLPTLLASNVTKNSVTDKYELVLTEKNRPIPYKPQGNKQVTDIYQYSAVFWNQYVADKTNDYLTELMEELTTFLGIEYSSATITKAKDSFVNVLVQKGYVAPYTVNNSVDMYVDWRINK